MRKKLDATLLSVFPGYAIIKGFVDNLHETEQTAAGTFVPVLVRFDDYVQIALGNHRDSAGKVAVALFPEHQIMVRHGCLRFRGKSSASRNDAHGGPT